MLHLVYAREPRVSRMRIVRVNTTLC